MNIEEKTAYTIDESLTWSDYKKKNIDIKQLCTDITNCDSWFVTRSKLLEKIKVIVDQVLLLIADYRFPSFDKYKATNLYASFVNTNYFLCRHNYLHIVNPLDEKLMEIINNTQSYNKDFIRYNIKKATDLESNEPADSIDLVNRCNELLDNFNPIKHYDNKIHPNTNSNVSVNQLVIGDIVKRIKVLKEKALKSVIAQSKYT